MVEFLKDQHLLGKQDDDGDKLWVFMNIGGIVKARKGKIYNFQVLLFFIETCAFIFVLAVFSQRAASFPMMMQPPTLQMGIPQTGIPQMGFPQMGIPQMGVPQMVSDIQHFPPPVPQIALPNSKFVL